MAAAAPARPNSFSESVRRFLQGKAIVYARPRNRAIADPALQCRMAVCNDYRNLRVARPEISHCRHLATQQIQPMNLIVRCRNLTEQFT
jgi:hypothetical protein